MRNNYLRIYYSRLKKSLKRKIALITNWSLLTTLKQNIRVEPNNNNLRHFH